jgi:hypothetical protein
LTWPTGELPVEIFTLIIDHLPRSSIQNLRLVNKEFDLKVSEALFKVVVVPFRPEIYGITPESTTTNDSPQGSVMLQDTGMRVFQGLVNEILICKWQLLNKCGADSAGGFKSSP